MAHLGQLPNDFEVGHPTDHEHEVEGTFPDHLIGEIDVSGPYEPSFGDQLRHDAASVQMGTPLLNRMRVSSGALPSLQLE
jgi:hypothetical protein